MDQQLQYASKHLSSNDPVLQPVIAAHGTASFAPHKNYYSALGDSIIGQQLSVKAAATIKQRFRDLFDGAFPTPEQILITPIVLLRSAGLSGAKARYIQDLAQHIIDGRITFKNLDAQSNEEIIAELTDVKGIGEWTVHMFLMFCMGRLDVLAAGDLGVRNGIRNLYGLEQAPTPKQVAKIAADNHWHPYESVACWYLWRSLDNSPN